MWTELPFLNLLAMLTALTGLAIVAAGWLYFVMSRTRAAKINLRVFGVSVEINMTKNRRKEDCPLKEQMKESSK